MRYVHKLGEETGVESSSSSFLLARKAGGYLSLGIPNSTRYQGLTAILPWGDTWELFKSLEQITINDTPEAIVLLPDSAERVYRNALERFAVQEDAVQYELSHYTGPVRLTLDMRAIHDFETWGRHYTIQDVPGGHVVTYSCPRYQFCLAILGAKGVWKPSWTPVHYRYDERRASRADFHVLECLEYACMQSLRLRFGVGYTPAEALAKANGTAPQRHELSHTSMDAAFQAAIADLDGLVTKLPRLDVGVLAGYPWFYQVYNRDESISVGALIRLGNTDLARRILIRALQHLHDDGRIANRFPQSEIASADGVGWTFLRLHELFVQDALSGEDLRYVQQALSKALDGLQARHMKDGLITNGWKETWMDTTGGYEDGRAGARIEIQALTLNMYAFMAALCERTKDGDTEYFVRKEELLLQAVRERFFDPVSSTLADGIDDHIDRTVRPNIFIAYYAYPDLLTQQEWQRVFSHALTKLWLPWGGLSTIGKEHLLFTPSYTGETDKSYHRGDSWYFLNNIAAMCLADTGFTERAEQMYHASRLQLLQYGVPGHAAETSSAGKQEGVGCCSQAWSAATFVELHLARLAWSLPRSSS